MNSTSQAGCRHASSLVLRVSLSGRTKPLRRLRSRLELTGTSTVTTSVERPASRNAPDHVLGDLAVARDVELVPAVIGRQPAQVLDRAGGGARHDEGDVGGPGGLRQHHVAAAAEEGGAPGRRDADGACVGPAEDGGALVARGDVDAVARHQADALEGVLVAGEPVLVVEAALDEVVGELRQPALGELAQVLEVDGGIDTGGKAASPMGWAGR